MSDSENISSREQSLLSLSDISVESDDDIEDLVSGLASDSADVSDCSTKFGAVKVSVVKDEIGKQKADVIVNTTATDLKLNVGGVSKGLLGIAGEELQNECNSKYPNGITHGDIAVTGGAKLQCKEVYHVSCKPWNGEQTRKELKEILCKCLEKASDSGHTSIAFPAIGSGLNKYPKETVAKILFSCVEHFQKRHTETSLVDVRCVIYPADSAAMEAFVARCKKITVDTSNREICLATRHHVIVHLIVGNLAEQNCDVMVTTSTRGIKLAGGRLSHYILDVAGPNLKTEIEEKYPRGIQHGEIAVLSPGGLPCKQLYCGALPRHDRPSEGSDPPDLLFRKMILACLNQAIKDRAHTICFPTIGTGYLMFPAEVSAKNMLQAISEFASNNQSTSLIIYIVLHNKEESLRKNLQVFERVCRTTEVEKPKAVPRKTPPPATKPKPGKSIQQPRLIVGGATGVSRQPNGTSSKPVDIPARNTPEFCLYMYGSDISPPSHWTKYTSDKTVKTWKIEERGKPVDALVDVDQATFNMVDNLVQKTWEAEKIGHGRDAAGLGTLGYNKLKVTKVQRIENLTLLDIYRHSQQQLFHKAGEGPMFKPLSKIQGVKLGEPATFQRMDSAMKKTLYTEVNEGYLFHGSKRDNVMAKVKEGLDPRLANVGAVFGQAVYMSESSTKADQYTDDRNKRETTGLTIFLVRCTMGDICVMTDTKKLTRPPCKVSTCSSDKCTHDDRYNSVVEEGKYIFREFCVYEKNQAYPEYVITYDRVNV